MGWISTAPHSRLIVGFFVIVAIAGLTWFFLPGSASSAKREINIDSNSVAIHGYDTVAYFTQGKAVKGFNEFEHVWEGAKWHFTSAEHRDLFEADPERYSPRFGGHCSLGIAIGEFSDVDPENWTIVDGKLYLNKNKEVQKLWRKGVEQYVFAAELNWKKYRDELRINENLKNR